MPNIDVARLNALRPKTKPSENPPETVRIPLDDEVDSMEVDRVPKGRTVKQRTRHPTQPSIDLDVPTLVDRRLEFGRRGFDLLGTRRFCWEEKDEYGIYRDNRG